MLQRTNLSKLCKGDLVLEKLGNVFYFFQNTEDYNHKQGFIYTPNDLSAESVKDNKHIVAIIEYAEGYDEPAVHFAEDSIIQSTAEDEVKSIVDYSDDLKSVSV